jgi:hypothetical protein
MAVSNEDIHAEVRQLRAEVAELRASVDALGDQATGRHQIRSLVDAALHRLRTSANKSQALKRLDEDTLRQFADITYQHGITAGRTWLRTHTSYQLSHGAVHRFSQALRRAIAQESRGDRLR